MVAGCYRLAGFLFALLAFWTCACSATLRILSSERQIDLSTPIARVSRTLKITNVGDGAANQVAICMSSAQAKALSYQKVIREGRKDELELVEASDVGAPEGVVCQYAVLPKALSPGGSTTLVSTEVFTGLQVPKPATLFQGEKQLMVYTDNLYEVSPYEVASQITEVLLPSSDVVSYTDEKPASKGDRRVTFGRYDEDKVPFSFKELLVHYRSDRHFKNIVKAVREIEVSHWGNIYVEEKYIVKNSGAKHEGAFSRLGYSSTSEGKTNGFQDLTAHLPPDAHSLYYVDLIGNISSSNTRKTLRETTVDIELRYPLMGGWQVDFTLGYSLPLKKYLFQTPEGNRRLVMKFATPFEDVVVDELEVRVVLPEGASQITSKLPFPVETSRDTKYTYLDTEGRPVLVLHKSNVVPDLNLPFQIDYSFSTISMMKEPLLLIAVFAASFAVVILFNRTEVTLGKGSVNISTVMNNAAEVTEVMQRVLEDLVKGTRRGKSFVTPGLKQDWESAEQEGKRLVQVLKDAGATAQESALNQALTNGSSIYSKLLKLAQEISSAGESHVQKTLEQCIEQKASWEKQCNTLTEI